MREAVAELGIHLGVRIVVHVSVRTCKSSVSAILTRCIEVRENTSVIVRQAHSRRDWTFIVRRVEIPVVRRLAQQCWVVGPGAKWVVGVWVKGNDGEAGF